MSVIVIRGGKILLSKGYGLADHETKVPCSPTTDFRLASVTKQFTAMAILILADRKKLSLDESLTAIFPEFPPYGSKITVRHLLTHTSGLLDYEDLIPTGTTLPVLDRDVLRLLAQQDKTYSSPGSKFKYSNSGYALLALAVEERSGRKFSRFLKEEIFEPLGMNRTLAYEQGGPPVPNRAWGYSERNGKWERTDQSLTSSVLGDGGIYSSVADLFKWDQALYTGRLVKKRLVRLAMTAAVETEKPGIAYGFGWYVSDYRGLREIWHSGNTIGFTTRIVRFPEKKFTVILLANRSEAELGAIAEKLADLYPFEGDTTSTGKSPR